MKTYAQKWADLKANPKRYAKYLAYQRRYLKQHPEYRLRWGQKNRQHLKVYNDSKRAALLAQGLCPRCWHRPLAPLRRRCQECLVRERQLQKIYDKRRRRRAIGRRRTT